MIYWTFSLLLDFPVIFLAIGGDVLSTCYYFQCTTSAHKMQYMVPQYTQKSDTVVPLLKDTLYRGHPSRKDTNSWQQVLWMHVMLPLIKGHLSNKDTIIGRKGILIRGGLL